VGVTLLCLAFVDKSCRGDVELREAKAQYEAAVAEREAAAAAHAADLARIEAVIAQQNEKIAQYVANIQTYHAEITTLRGQLADLQADEPVQPELEDEPLVINLRAQVARLTEMFVLAQRTSSEKDGIIVSLNTIVAAKDEAIAAWRGQYEGEHALRVQCEALFKKSESARKANSIGKKVALVVAAGAAIYAVAK